MAAEALATTEKLYPYQVAECVIREHLARMGRDPTVDQQRHLGYYRVTWSIAWPEPKVAIIIPTKGKVDLPCMVVNSILGKTAYRTHAANFWPEAGQHVKEFNRQTYPA
ncbi:hypothetical protein [Paraburkholderia sp. BR10954]|uniref:hypothetical protein n=1 Tax=Paraburkholderia sp. BR10954 TaxID=3236995 RepID=UPI0034D1CE35